MSCAQGSQSYLLMKEGSSPYTWTSGASAYEFIRETISRNGKIVHSPGIRGTRSQRSERTRKGPYNPGGTIHMHLSAGDAPNPLKWVTGGTPTGTTTITYPLSESLVTFGVIVEKVTEQFEAQNAVVNQLILHGRQNGPGGAPNFIDVWMELFAKDVAVGTFPASPAALGSTAPFAPYVFEDTTLTLMSATREVKEWWLGIRNFVDRRAVNSLTPTSLCPSDRAVFFRVRLPYDTDTDDLYGQELDYGTGSLSMSQGSTYTTAFSFADLRAPTDTPHVVVKTEIDITLDFVAYKSGSTSEITVTNKASN